jgi:hypothetical protein
MSVFDSGSASASVFSADWSKLLLLPLSVILPVLEASTVL